MKETRGGDDNRRMRFLEIEFIGGPYDGHKEINSHAASGRESHFACLLVGLGVRELSLSLTRAAAVRHALRRIGCRDALEVAELALRCRTPQQVRELLQPLQSIEVIAD